MDTSRNVEFDNHRLAFPTFKVVRSNNKVNSRNCISNLDDNCMDDDVWFTYSKHYQGERRKYQASNHCIRSFTQCLLDGKLYIRCDILGYTCLCSDCWYPRIWVRYWRRGSPVPDHDLYEPSIHLLLLILVWKRWSGIIGNQNDVLHHWNYCSIDGFNPPRSQWRHNSCRLNHEMVLLPIPRLLLDVRLHCHFKQSDHGVDWRQVIGSNHPKLFWYESCWPQCHFLARWNYILLVLDLPHWKRYYHLPKKVSSTKRSGWSWKLFDELKRRWWRCHRRSQPNQKFNWWCNACEAQRSVQELFKCCCFGQNLIWPWLWWVLCSSRSFWCW